MDGLGFCGVIEKEHTAVEGDDADECPESGPDWRNPKMEQFPSN